MLKEWGQACPWEKVYGKVFPGYSESTVHITVSALIQETKHHVGKANTNAMWAQIPTAIT